MNGTDSGFSGSGWTVSAAVRVTGLGLVVATAVGLAGVPASAAADGRWPANGEAAYTVGGGRIVASPHQPVVAIASVAKVMTAYLVLQSAPLTAGHNGFTLRVTQRDVRDTARRASEDQSLVPVRAGERLSEREALAALLLPSANNVAIMLARHVAGSVPAFVRRMNRTALALHMTRTRYTDPSGFLPSTRSTARDQVRLALTAMKVTAFVFLVSRHTYRIPFAGRIHNTDTLLGHDGFTGIKTGSDSAAGGCFAFRSWHRVHGTGLAITGVVLGQPGGDLISSGLNAGRRLVDHVVSEARS